MSFSKNILIVEDDDDFRALLVEQFSAETELNVQAAPSLAAARATLSDDEPDLMVLDVNLPDGDGRDFCRELRENGMKTPIIMVTASEEENVEVDGLTSGANDHVAKPVKFDVLLARVRAHLRTHEQSEHATFAIGPYKFRPAAKTLETPEGKRIRLTEKETNILRYLKKADGATVSRETLLHEVWGYNPNVTTHTLETHVYRLRQKIEPDPKLAKIVITSEGGYRLGEQSG